MGCICFECQYIHPQELATYLLSYFMGCICFECQYIHPQELATYLLSYFMGCVALVRCVLVLRCGSAGVEWYPYAGWSFSFSLHKDTRTPQPNNTVTPTHIEQEQHNPWNKATNKSQAPEDGCTIIRNTLSIKQWNNKARDIKLVYLHSNFLVFAALSYGINGM